MFSKVLTPKMTLANFRNVGGIYTVLIEKSIFHKIGIGLLPRMRQYLWEEIKLITWNGWENFPKMEFKHFRELQILLLILGDFKWINQLLFPLKYSGRLWFSNDFKGNKSWLICLQSLNNRSEIWRWSLQLSVIMETWSFMAKNHVVSWIILFAFVESVYLWNNSGVIMKVPLHCT